jgi:hypothetical protein
VLENPPREMKFSVREKKFATRQKKFATRQIFLAARERLTRALALFSPGSAADYPAGG